MLALGEVSGEFKHLVAAELLLHAVDVKLDLGAVGIDLYPLLADGSYLEAFARHMDEFILRPIGFVYIERIFSRLAVDGDEAFVIPAANSALVP